MAKDEASDETVVKNAIEACFTAQTMIDINAKHLEGLRTECTTSAELTQHEIRTLENKLLRLFSRQITAKQQCQQKNSTNVLSEFPKLKLWLQVVGLDRNSVEKLSQEVETMEALLQLSEAELKKLLQKFSVNEEERRCLLGAQRNLKTYNIELLQMCGDKSNLLQLDLHWDSWNQNSGIKDSIGRNDQPQSKLQIDDPYLKSDYDTWAQHSYYHYPPASNMVNSYPGISGTSPIASMPERHYTPPPTPSSMGRKGDKKFPTTPPPSKKHQTTLLPEAFPLTKSKSHEEHLSNRIEPVDTTLISSETIPRRRLATEPGLDTVGVLSYGPMSQGVSPNRSPPFISPENQSDYCFEDEVPPLPPILTAPRSPRARGMAHSINHRFTSTMKMTTCHLCEKPMLIGFKCKECKFTCHRDCVDKVPPSCGLPRELVDVFVQSVREEEEEAGKNERELRRQIQNPSINIPAFACPDSSSNTSSCNSSSPSSPAFLGNALYVHQNLPSTLTQHFHFPEVPESHREITKPSVESELAETQTSNDSDKTASGTSGSGSISTDSERTIGGGRVDSQESQVSDTDPNEKGWPRQNSLSLKEWDIPYDELQIEDQIGPGRFGTVYKGKWHGDVAVKMLSMDPLDDKRTLETFKQEVAIFRKTRHENLVLFMGACMKPPHLAIVTSLCKGMTLYTHIHLRKDKFILSRTVSIARQISQGMGYLHARGVVHKDLKTKNIFYENGKVVITDFGLFSITKLCQKSRSGEWLAIPKGWLCYLAPEVIRSLRADNQLEGDFPFSTASDVYAFGTVWYELLCGDWPFQGLPPEAVIWQVGKGIRQPLANIQSSKELKDLIMMCWSYKPSDRPDFGKMLTILSQLPLLPKKRLARSPSHPVHLSRMKTDQLGEQIL